MYKSNIEEFTDASGFEKSFSIYFETKN